MSYTKMLTSLAHVELSAESPAMQASVGPTAAKPRALVLLQKWIDSALQLRSVPDTALTAAEDGSDADWEAWLHASGRAVR